MVINELPYKMRMKKENMILASLWFGNQKPSMGTFLKPFQRSMKELYNGIKCHVPGQGTFTTRGILLCGTADLPARSLLCNHIQYNGAYSCWKCEQEGTSEAVGRGHARVYPFIENDPIGPAQNVLCKARQAVENQNNRTGDKIIKGIKGPSWLLFFPTFDIIAGIAIDYMHGVLLGVQKMLLELWFLTKYSNKNFNFSHKQEILDQRLMQIRPTLDITRLLRSIQDLKYWKSSEYRSFLLYFGAPVLHDILDKTRFSHFLLLVNSMHILLKCGSTNNDINKAEEMLVKFCKHFEELYDRCFLRLNVHQLLHLPQSVRNLGPLYTHSCFSFEDKNGVLLKMIKGTQCIDNQIVTGVSFVQKLPELKDKCIAKGSLCEKIYNSIESVTILKRTRKLEEGVYVLGGVKERMLSEKEQDALLQYVGHDPLSTKLRSFGRIELHGDVIYGTSYSRMVKKDNSVVEYKNRQNVCFGRVRFFIFFDVEGTDEILAVIEKLKCPHYKEGSHILNVTITDDAEVQNIRQINSSCMIVTFDGATMHYVCKFPNKMESD